MTNPYCILVTGSREWPLRRIVEVVLEELVLPHVLIQRPVIVRDGAAKGVDTFAGEWSNNRKSWGITRDKHPVTPEDWRKIGRGAGLVRNIHMLTMTPKPDICVGFVLNASNGASHCLREARKAGIPTLQFGMDGPVGLLPVGE